MTCPPDQDELSLATCPQSPEPADAAAIAVDRLTARLASWGEAARSSGTTITLHPVVRTVALVAWAALSGACGAQGGDMKSVLPLLEKAALERLDQAAEQASDHVGGRRRVEPAEMLQIVDVSPTFELATAELVDNDGATAHVRLVGAQQESHTLTLVFEDGAWHVRLATPPLTEP